MHKKMFESIASLMKIYVSDAPLYTEHKITIFLTISKILMAAGRYKTEIRHLISNVYDLFQTLMTAPPIRARAELLVLMISPAIGAPALPDTRAISATSVGSMRLSSA